MIRGNMCCGVVGSELMLRVGPDKYEDTLNELHVREMDFTGKSMRGFVYISEQGIESDEDLELWLKRALTFSNSLPAK